MTTTTTSRRTTIPAEEPFDEELAERFAERLLETHASASAALLLSLGHRVGLFDAMDGLPPATSSRIAEVAQRQERYVREWLAGMHVSGVVEHDPDAGTWWLPPEHAAYVTRRAGSDNLAKLGQFISLLASVERDVATCFRDGGGLPYAAYDEFHELMAEDSWDLAEALLVDQVVPLVDGLPQRLRAGIRVADIGCGSGPHLTVLAEAFPASTFVGYDFEAHAIDRARAEATRRGLTNVHFEHRDVADLTGAGPFDLVTAFDAVHDQAHPATVLSQVAATLAPDGVFLVVEPRASSRPHENVDLPLGSFLYAVSLLHCTPVSLAFGGAGLGAAWGIETATRMLDEAGFAQVDVANLEGDVFNTYLIARR